jgi:hypothetical protein
MRTAAQFGSPLRVALAVACLLAAAGPGVAQQPRVKIAAARVGLPPGERSTDRDENQQPAHVSKFAAWVPVYLDLEVLDAVTEPAEVVVETPDADGVATTLTVPIDLAGARPGTTVTARDLGKLPYLRPAAGTGETTITLRTAKGEPLSEPFRVRSLRPKDALTYIVLALGSKLPAFDLPRPTGAPEGETTGPLRGGRVELAAITDVGMLPDQWFGYDAADVVVLTTSSAEFTERLFGEKGSAADKAKRAALLEWVRRGGRVVVAVGANAGLVARLPALLDILPYTIKPDAPTRPAAQLDLYWSARETSQQGILGGSLVAKGGTVPAANLVPRPSRAGRVVIPPPSRQTDDTPTVAAQAGYGLGRVTLIGFDLDRSPFTEFGRKDEFWDWVLREGGANRASVGADTKPRGPAAGPTDDEDELAVALRTHVDTFEGVPVISFGWVAVFIALYIVLIGPVEYYVLKRVLGRLELTWVTFPVIVATVCAAAYFTAYAVKGRDLRVNKVDVIDVVAESDPQTGKPGGRVFGSTWFTVFSPKIEAYTVGVTPAEGWTAPGESGASLVGWVGGPRTGRASLIRRRYEYHTDPATGAVADGLIDVPIQVWSTKSFSANWAGTMDPAAPVLESRLVHPAGDPTRAIGTFVNRMPFDEVTDCTAFYAGQAYRLGTILHGQEVRLVLDKGQPVTQWLQENSQLPEALARAATGERPAPAPGRPGDAAAPVVSTGTFPFLGVLFHEGSLRNDEGVFPRNASLRRLDQSWRLAAANRDEVIVVGRVLPPPGAAEPLLGGRASPSRVWLKELPGAGKERPAVPGTGRQETYVRLYLPVKPAERTEQ